MDDCCRSLFRILRTFLGWFPYQEPFSESRDLQVGFHVCFQHRDFFRTSRFIRLVFHPRNLSKTLVTFAENSRFSTFQYYGQWTNLPVWKWFLAQWHEFKTCVWPKTYHFCLAKNLPFCLLSKSGWKSGDEWEKQTWRTEECQWNLQRGAQRLISKMSKKMSV